MPSRRPGLISTLGAFCALFLASLAGCARSAPSPAPTTAASQTPFRHAPEIRFALIGDATEANVWALFDAAGYSYNDYAVRSGYWPRLYRLSIPEHEFEAEAASGMPSAVQPEGALYTAMVRVRSDLDWTDRSAFSADDVAFTVNTALRFHLGFDWQDRYDPAWLDHAEALDQNTVKFYFKRAPNVGIWQYGALQGPIVQSKFWSPRVAASAGLLPASDLLPLIEELKARVANLQAQVEALNTAASTGQGEEARQVQSGLRRQQGDLDQAFNELAKAQGDFDSAIKAARAALYALDDQGEPQLGAWIAVPSSGTTLENKANLLFPEAPANFDRAVYRFYPTRESAVAALQSGEVDVVLDPSAAAAARSASQAATLTVMDSPTRSVRYLVFNPRAGSWSTRPLRQALACIIDQRELAAKLGARAAALTGLISPLESAWHNPAATLSCEGLDAAARLAGAIRILKTAGYAWTEEPSQQSPGQGLASASEGSLPALDLLVPESDELRTGAAAYVQTQARLLGVPVIARPVPADMLNFAVFSSHTYSLALLGWKVSSYPGYWCDWIGAGKPFEQDSSRITSACGELEKTNELDEARRQVFDLQTELAQDVPFIPLYTEAALDVYRNVTYPFKEVMGGLSGAYGAPEVARPAPP